MPEEEKIKFYKGILNNNFKAQSTTWYQTATNLAKQAKIFPVGYRQPNGNLQYIAPLRRGDKKITSLFFLCLCDCGNYCILESNSFRKEKQKSCFKCSLKNCGKKVMTDLTGQVFGQLKAIKPTEKRGSDGSVYWLCECIDCGHQQEVVKYNLRDRGHLCAICGSNSIGEYQVAKLLQENNINFVKEKVFDDCIYPTGNKARFDFYVNSSYIIEIDGQHHFKPERYSNNISKQEAISNYEKQRLRDNIKNEYCFKNNIPIIRIPYSYYRNKSIELKDILLESSNFILKNYNIEGENE